MPFTPYHLGPSSWIGLLSRRAFDFPALLVSCVIVDIEPFLVLSFRFNYPLHGYAHTFLFGTAIALLSALGMYALRRRVQAFFAVVKLKQDSSFWKIIAATIFGVYSHVFLDSMLYTDIRPFWPLDMNPFLDMMTSRQVYGFCLVSFVPGGVVYLWHCYKTAK